MVNLLLSTVVFLSLLASAGGRAEPAQDSPERLFLNAPTLTGHTPLEIPFHKGEIRIGDNTRAIIQAWAHKIAEYSLPVHVYSYAGLPRMRRNLTEPAARHDAVRVAFKRARHVKALLETAGVSEKRIILHAIGAADYATQDKLEITTRRK